MVAYRTVDELIGESIRFERSGQIGVAAACACMALEQARAQNNSEDIATALLRVGEIQYRLGHYADATANAAQSLDYAGQMSRARADALIVLGNCTFETDSLFEAESFFLRAADLCRQIGYEHSRFRALHNLATCIYSLRGQFDLALAADQEAYRIACELKSDQQMITLIAIGGIYLQLRQYQLAHATLDKIAQSASAGSLFQGYYFLLAAWLAQNEGDLQMAASFFVPARSIAEAFGDPALQILIRIAQSQYHQFAGNMSAALEWANDAVAWASRTGNHRMLGRALIERARAGWLNGNAALAENDLHRAIDDLAARQQLYDLARARFLLAVLRHAQNGSDAESVWFDAARQIVGGGFAFILDQDRTLAYPLIAAHLNSANSIVTEISAQCVEHLQRVPPPPLRIITLGAFDVWQGTRRVQAHALHKRRAGDLLILLILASSHSLSFDQIADALWNDKDRSAAQALFHQSTSALRRALEPELPDKFPSRYVHVEEGQVTLNLPTGSTIDFQIFEEHCRKEEWNDALQIYQGDLLPDHLYADWAVVPRERLKRSYLRALLIVAHRQMQAGHARETLDACYRILEIDSWHEDAVLLGMKACLAFNDRAGALRLYRDLERTLRDELNTTPQPALRELYESLL